MVALSAPKSHWFILGLWPKSVNEEKQMNENVTLEGNKKSDIFDKSLF